MFPPPMVLAPATGYVVLQMASTRREGGGGLITPLARATRGRELPSHGQLARLGMPAGGRVRKPSAVGDQSAPIPEERTNELGGIK